MMVTGARQKLTLTVFILATKEIGELAHPIAIQGPQGTKVVKVRPNIVGRYNIINILINFLSN